MIAESVYPISYSDLRENGGAYKLTRDAEAVIAIPSYDVSAKATQGPARPVYVLSEDEVSWRGGPFKVIQSQNARVVKFVPGGRGAPHPEGRRDYQAQPVYVVGGTSDHYLKLLRLFGRSIIAYWPMWEQTPSVYAFDQSRNRFDGIYKNVTLGQPGIGDGRTSALFNGTTSFMQPPAGFRTAFNGREGSAFIWLQIAAAVWTDATVREFFTVQADASNRVFANRTATNNQIQCSYIAGGTSKSVTLSSFSPIIFFHIGITWSLSKAPTGEMIFYVNGAQSGAIQTGLGTFVGTPAAANTVIGALNATPANPHKGLAAHACFLNRPATPAEMAAAAVI